MSPIKAPHNLPELVKAAFARARASGALAYFPTEVTILSPNSIPFQLRFSPALASKPKGPAPPPGAPKKVFNPFENPDPELLVAELPPDHRLVLNKFAVVPEHFLLVTRVFQQQTHLLEPADLAATYACLEAYAERGTDEDGELFAFFNSGVHSGASQPHRHLQLLPVARMKDGIDEADKEKWGVLAAKLTDGALHSVPFMTFSTEIHPGMLPDDLHDTYLSLYGKAVAAVQKHLGTKDVGGQDEDQHAARISYNLAMTRTTLAMLPRLAEGADIIAADGKMAGILSLNGTVLAGTALVKNASEWEALRNDPDQLLAVLNRIGIPAYSAGLSGNL